MITFSQLGRQGRFGNCCFQISAVLAHSQQNMDTPCFPAWQYNQFLKHPLPERLISYKHVYLEPHFHFSPIPFKPDTDLRGYFQSEKYWHSYVALIKQQFEPVETLVQELYSKYRTIIEHPKSVSWHIRLGDFKTLQDYHPVQPQSYFDTAMKTLEISSDALVCVFSDEPDLLQDYKLPPNSVIIHDNTDVVDFYLMSMCKDNIISNSSFSWFSAYLNKNHNKRIAAPRNWFGPKLKHDTKDLYCKDWIVI